MEKEDYVKKPPIGVMPKKVWIIKALNERRLELESAIIRYLKAGLGLEKNWLEELTEINVILNNYNLTYENETKTETSLH